MADQDLILTRHIGRIRNGVIRQNRWISVECRMTQEDALSRPPGTAPPPLDKGLVDEFRDPPLDDANGDAHLHAEPFHGRRAEPLGIPAAEQHEPAVEELRAVQQAWISQDGERNRNRFVVVRIEG